MSTQKDEPMNFKARLVRESIRKESKLILALDVKGPEDSRVRRGEKILKEVKESVAAVKLNLHMLLPFGLNGVKPIVDLCSKEGIPLIADIKLNDISSTNLEVARQLIRHRIDAVIANPIVGFNEGLDKLVELSHAGKLGLILLVFMSHKGAAEMYSAADNRLYLVFAAKAKEWDVDGVIVSAKSDLIINEVRGIIGRHLLILSPGVGAQGAEPNRPIKAGANFIIVGRSIVNSVEPRKVAERYRAMSYLT